MLKYKKKSPSQNLADIAKKSFLALAITGIGLSAQANINENTVGTRIAFMPDIHFHDVYGEYQDDSFEGLPNSKSGKNATIRSMLAQLTSTRLFNEQYFALLAALDDAAERGIKYIALPGDFSDDGQPIHIRGIARIFREYSEKYGMVFLAAPGNHDPVRPYTRPGGEKDMLGKGGIEQHVYSKGYKECVGYETPTATIKTDQPLATICTEEMSLLGYQEIMEELGDFGFYASKDYVFWETPYSDYSYDKYSLKTALDQGQYENRMYEICAEGTGGKYKQEGYSNCYKVPDSTYLVEPFEGLWLLAIDANVYVPKSKTDGKTTNAANYNSPSNAGYNKLITHKQQVLDYIADVVRRADQQGKTLVAFSHYPMTDFYNGAAEKIEDIFGQGNFQLKRVPGEDVSKALADTGLKLHVGGHMHFNDTGVRRYENGNFLFNVQAPSMAAYVPAYKILTLGKNQKVDVETAIIEDVPRFDELFEHYKEELAYLKKSGAKNVWSEDVLDTDSYYEFTNMHIQELTRLRFLPREWPKDMREMLFNMSGRDMLVMSQLQSNISIAELNRISGGKNGVEMYTGNTEGERFDDIDNPQFREEWQAAEKRAKKLAKNADLSLGDFEDWTAYDLAVDFYRLRNADELAFKDIDRDRIPQYRLLARVLRQAGANVEGLNAKDVEQLMVGDLFKSRFSQLFNILTKFSNGEASDHFVLDMKSGKITDLAEPIERI